MVGMMSNLPAWIKSEKISDKLQSAQGEKKKGCSSCKVGLSKRALQQPKLQAQHTEKQELGKSWSNRKILQIGFRLK